jgi:ribosomal protein S18 acetylase RimI-like enzyme
LYQQANIWGDFLILNRFHRGQGLAKRAVKKLLDTLIADGVEAIGLNVEANNESAIALYQSLGFQKHIDYEEAVVLEKN